MKQVKKQVKKIDVLIKELEALKLAVDAATEERERNARTHLNPRPIEAAPKDGSFVLVWLPITKIWTSGEFQEGIGFNGHYNYISDDPWEEPEWFIPMLSPPK